MDEENKVPGTIPDQQEETEASLPAGNDISLEAQDDTLTEKDIVSAPQDEKSGKKKKKDKKKRRVPLFVLIIFIVVAFVGGLAAGSIGLLAILGKSSGLDTTKVMAKLNILQQCVSQYFLDDYDEDDLEEGIYRGFMNALDDPYSTYYSSEEYKQLTEEDSGEYKGIGVTVSKNADNNYAEVQTVFKDDPAYKAGVKTGDFITKVNGKDTSTMTLTEVVTEIKSSEDPVVLTIYRDTKELEISVSKSTISVDSISYEMKDSKIGYISVSQFLENTDEQFSDAVDDLESQGMKGLIIDLRDNGGGLLDTCVNMVSRIIPEGDLIVYTQDKYGNKTDYDSDSDATLDIPIVILVNGNTASASEIMTGCLKDYDLATVLGTTTFGKGIVQSILPLSDGSAIKLTVSAYYTPNGVNIHKKGIEPDETIEMTDEEWAKAIEDPSTDKEIKRAMEILTDSKSK